jgi:predicted MFS family arabinose efflux permease
MGLKLSKGRRLVAMSIRTSAGQFGYLLGAVLGGILLETRGFAGVAWGFGLVFALAGLIYLPGAMEPGFLARARLHLRRQPVSQ